MTSQRGAATVVSLVLAGVLFLVGLAGSWVGGVVVRHRAAQSAADLTALAGAEAIQTGRAPCPVADRVARENQARMTRCEVSGQEIWIGVEVSGPALLGRVPTLAGLAHAGPRR
ncbi:Rv3654c family TadE-like protein [Nocardioides sp.]|uniref:Rv3654c family TadE-like protein n=1 Tax=Nocardioides sp. TaxID=35761 RepID=UPI003D113B48